jgi:drug/metabolite transporter (DMT)-like permease
MLAEHLPPPWVIPTFFLIAVMVSVLSIAFWIWMLWDCIKNELPGSRQRLAWVIFIGVFGVFGAFCYNIGRRKTRIRELGR